jgi:choline dehydrogenase-like flavoprotein
VCADRVIVIGSGPVGAMAARELVRRGIPVTMLESGTSQPAGWLLRARGRNLFRRAPAVSSDERAYVATGDPETAWFEHRGPGGMSNQWTGAVPRFAPADFHEGERLHESYRWPICYDDLVPYYEEAERVLDITASPHDVPSLPAACVRHERWLPRDWMAVARVAERHGQGLTALPLADGPEWLLARRGTAFNSFTSIVHGLLRTPTFELRTGAHALRLEWSGARRRVESVTYYDRGRGHEEQLPAAAVVVAGGPLRSTKLLLDSTCADFPDGLGNADGILGRFLHDHPKEWWSFATQRPLSRMARGGYLTRRPHTSSPPLLATSWTIGNANDRDKLLSFTPLRATRFGVQVFGSMVPSEQHHVRSSPTQTDEFGLPQLEIRIDFDRETVTNVEEARAHLISIMGESGYCSTLDPVHPQLVPGISAHYGGTVRMHRRRTYGVLDEWNRPFDIPNLVVSDASCFTTNTEKNPTLTAMAISARAAHRLADDLRSGLV